MIRAFERIGDGAIAWARFFAGLLLLTAIYSVPVGTALFVDLDTLRTIVPQLLWIAPFVLFLAWSAIDAGIRSTRFGGLSSSERERATSTVLDWSWEWFGTFAYTFGAAVLGFAIGPLIDNGSDSLARLVAILSLSGWWYVIWRGRGHWIMIRGAIEFEKVVDERQEQREAERLKREEEAQ